MMGDTVARDELLSDMLGVTPTVSDEMLHLFIMVPVVITVPIATGIGDTFYSCYKSLHDPDTVVGHYYLLLFNISMFVAVN